MITLEKLNTRLLNLNTEIRDIVKSVDMNHRYYGGLSEDIYGELMKAYSHVQDCVSYVAEETERKAMQDKPISYGTMFDLRG